MKYRIAQDVIFVNRLKLLSNIPKFRLPQEALKSEINNKAFQILTSVLETKHLSTSAEFKIHSNLKLPSEILGWGAVLSVVSVCKVQPCCVKPCMTPPGSRAVLASSIRRRWLPQPPSGSRQGCTAHGSLASAL